MLYNCVCGIWGMGSFRFGLAEFRVRVTQKHFSICRYKLQNHDIIYSFIHSFSNCFILVRLVMDLEPIPETLGVQKDRDAPLIGHQSITCLPCTHVQFRVASPSTGMFFGDGRNLD